MSTLAMTSSKRAKVTFVVAAIVTCFGCLATPLQDDRLEMALDRVLGYILEHNEHINVDGLFGVVFAQVHLDAVLKNKLSPNERVRLQKLKNKADLIYAVIKPHLYNGDQNQITFVEEIVDTDLWHRDIDFRRGLVTPMPPKTTRFSFDTYDEYIAYLSSSNMSETQSDECMLQLIASGSRTYLHECHLSRNCRHRMVDDPHYDPTYGITHRLLYLQIGRARLCAMNSQWYRMQTRNYCSYILWEAAKNANFGFLDELDDVLFEQMTLCGYEGFAEFLAPEYVEHVLDAQTAHGCYGIPALQRSGSVEAARVRRSANLITYGCNDHTTGLGASTLALALRFQKMQQNISTVY